MLAHRIDELCFSQYLIMGKGDIKNNVQEKQSVKEDLFEAILGAITIDCDWNFKELQNVVELMLNLDCSFHYNLQSILSTSYHNRNNFYPKIHILVIPHYFFDTIVEQVQYYI